jgi:hypothetical protein
MKGFLAFRIFIRPDFPGGTAVWQCREGQASLLVAEQPIPISAACATYFSFVYVLCLNKRNCLKAVPGPFRPHAEAKYFIKSFFYP